MTDFVGCQSVIKGTWKGVGCVFGRRLKGHLLCRKKKGNYLRVARG
jgi:hypothetical protein